MTLPRDPDLAAEIEELRRRLSDLEQSAPLRAAAVGAGGIRVHGGGTVAVADGGDVHISDGGDLLMTGGGQLTYRDADGNRRFWIGDAGAGEVNFRYYTADAEPDDPTVWIGASYVGGVLSGHGLNIRLATVPFNLVTANIERGLRFRDSHGNLILNTLGDDHRLRLFRDVPDADALVYVGPVTWGGSSDGFGYRLIEEGSGSTIFHVSASRMRYHRRTGTGQALAQILDGDDVRAVIGQDGLAGLIGGGRGGTPTAIRSFWRHTGDGTPREIQARDGANNTYIDVRASDFIEDSTIAGKSAVRDADPGALDRVRATPIRRWRRAQPARSSPPDVADDGADDGAETATPPPRGPAATPPAPVPAPPADADEDPIVDRVGPIAEEMPDGLATDGGVRVTDALWTLWQAVQELSATVEAQQAEIDRLARQTRP